MRSEPDRLLELLRERSYRPGRFRLTSGRESDFFVDCKQTVLSGEGHVLVGSRMLDAIASWSPDAVAGVAVGGCPLASAVAMTSFQRGGTLDAVYVRKETKEHGTERMLEGTDRLPAGARIAVLEDVVTTGGSTLRAIEGIRAHGLLVVGVLAIVDREEGGADAIRGAGVLFSALYTRADFHSSLLA